MKWRIDGTHKPEKYGTIPQNKIHCACTHHNRLILRRKIIKRAPMTALSQNTAAKPGDLLPPKTIDQKPIYEKLSPTHWTLIVCGKEKIKFQLPNLKILHVPENLYSSRYLLIRPDKKIALTENEISEILLKNYFDAAI
jgi:hypothetical protein